MRSIFLPISTDDAPHYFPAANVVGEPREAMIYGYERGLNDVITESTDPSAEVVGAVFDFDDELDETVIDNEDCTVYFAQVQVLTERGLESVDALIDFADELEALDYDEELSKENAGYLASKEVTTVTSTTTTTTTSTTSVATKKADEKKKALAISRNRFEDTDTFDVYYFAYGSNLNMARFLRYANCGRTTEADKFTHMDSVKIEMPYNIYFAGHSGIWNGAVAFLDVDFIYEPSMTGRGWKLSWQQFTSLVSQENGATANLDKKELLETGATMACTYGKYARVVVLGFVGDKPIVTCTSPESYDEQVEKLDIPWQYKQFGYIDAPSRSYLNTINEGVIQTKALESVEVTYLDVDTFAEDADAEDIGDNDDSDSLASTENVLATSK